MAAGQGFRGMLAREFVSACEEKNFTAEYAENAEESRRIRKAMLATYRAGI